VADDDAKRIRELLEAQEARRARARRAWSRWLPVLLVVVVAAVWGGIAWANHLEDQRKTDQISCQYLESMTGGDPEDC
jgi:hypothetical protein